MNPLQPTSARALTIFSAVVMGVGFAVISPSAAFVCFLGAVALTAVPALFGAGKTRIVATVLLLVSLGMAVRGYPDFKKEQDQYRLHPKKSGV